MSTPVLFYDGGCGLCHGAVRLLLRLDAAGRLRFAPLGGATFTALVPEGVRAALPDSLVLRTSDGGLLLRSRAVVAALRLAGGEAAWLGGALSLLPAALADRLYDVVARGRRRLFASPRDACPVPPGPWRGRFLP
jgi:predicted DCC family thiol-disulfide oxidoreductase YuxK